MSTFYGGISKNGKSVVLVIDGKDWHWKKSRFLTNTFCHLPVGTKFDIDSEREGKSITVDWETLEIHSEYMDDVEIKQFILNDACAKKNRTLASAKKKLDAEKLSNLTVADLREHAMWMSRAQRQALISLVISELM
tara:strand:- start:52 stop:459 length:408 start_codon:yes stop_codon:yes gene_type:complete